jgi:hypothetical protein
MKLEAVSCLELPNPKGVGILFGPTSAAVDLFVRSLFV